MPAETDILNFLMTNWVETQISFPNVDFSRPSGSPWVNSQVVSLPPERLTISAHHRKSYILSMSVNWPENEGSLLAYEMAGRLAAFFPPDLRISGLYRVTAEPQIAGGFNTDDWFSVPVIVNLEELGK